MSAETNHNSWVLKTSTTTPPKKTKQKKKPNKQEVVLNDWWDRATVSFTPSQKLKLHHGKEVCLENKGHVLREKKNPKQNSVPETRFEPRGSNLHCIGSRLSLCTWVLAKNKSGHSVQHWKQGREENSAVRQIKETKKELSRLSIKQVCWSNRATCRVGLHGRPVSELSMCFKRKHACGTNALHKRENKPGARQVDIIVLSCENCGLYQSHRNVPLSVFKLYFVSHFSRKTPTKIILRFSRVLTKS